MQTRASIGCLLLLLACGPRGVESPGAETPEEVVEAERAPTVVEPLVLVSVVPISTARPIPRDCRKPLEETCNAIDDDCDGVIDDGCGYGAGFIQVTASWDNGADIDLYVTGPLGDTLSFQRPSTPAGARVDHSGRGDCSSMPNPQIENIRWVGARPAGGIYEVEIHHWGECTISGGGPANVTLSVAVGREIAAQYSQSLLPGERVRVLRFVVQ